MPPEIARLRSVVEHLAAIERPSASEGERVAAEWIRDRLDEHGWAARVEEERAHGGYWLPLGLLSAAAGAAGVGPGARGGAPPGSPPAAGGDAPHHPAGP